MEIYDLSNGCLVIQPSEDEKLGNAQYVHISRIGNNLIQYEHSRLSRNPSEKDCCHDGAIPYLVVPGDQSADCEGADLSEASINPASIPLFTVNSSDGGCSDSGSSPSAVTIIPQLDAGCNPCDAIDELKEVVQAELDETQESLTEVKDAVDAAKTEIVAAITQEGDETQAALAALQATIDDGVDVNATLAGIEPTVEAQLQALISAALNAAEPLQVEISGDTTALQNTLQAALQWAADNLQFEFLAAQNVTWTVDLSTATITAIQNAFEAALGNASPLDVNLTNTGSVTVALDQASIDALDGQTIEILGQPIDVNVTSGGGGGTVSGTVEIGTASINAIAQALAGETLNVNITNNPATITGTVNLGDVSALTDWLANNDLTIDGAAIIAAIDSVNTTLQTVESATLGGTTSIVTSHTVPAGLRAFTVYDHAGTGTVIAGVPIPPGVHTPVILDEGVKTTATTVTGDGFTVLEMS